VRREHARDRGRICDVGLDERDARTLQRAGKVQQATGVGQLVDDDEVMGRVVQGVLDQVRADEAGSACN
jgi:hypothetical protein